MQTIDPIEDRRAELAEIARSREETAALCKHVAEIVEGKEFRGSSRSRQFLRYVVEQAIAGNVESLKERVIGAELFGRPPAYETGEDAIVRVTASDVRKRLLQYYDTHGATSEFRISIPLGSYVPAIMRARRNGTGLVDAEEGGRELATPHVLAVAHQDFPSALQESAVTSPPVPQPETTLTPRRSWRLPLVFGILLVALNLALWAFYWSPPSRIKALPISTLPWSAIFNSPHSTQLITSDPNMPEIERFTGGQISVSDYANHKYLSGPNKLTSEQEMFCLTILCGNKASSDDTQTIANIAQLAQANARKIDVNAARQVQLLSLRTDDNFIFLGSPRSDPWTDLFSDQLDFRFVFDKATQSEFVLNVHPGQNERPTYVPTAKGFAQWRHLCGHRLRSKSRPGRTGSPSGRGNCRRHCRCRKTCHRPDPAVSRIAEMWHPSIRSGAAFRVAIAPEFHRRFSKSHRRGGVPRSARQFSSQVLTLRRLSKLVNPTSCSI